ncbi:MAG: hypothetical protein AMJ46_13895 [Latescibacteria bacterium DG_63]|nr:MAG: hypothetical protein AMJ46_13895 [Latescibacteria bacterium DG_63]
MTRRYISERVKVVAALVLAASVLLPLYALPGGGNAARYYYPWQFAREDPALAAALAAAYFWPVLVVGLRRLARSAAWRVIALISEPVLAAVSVFILWLLPAITLGFAPSILPWLVIPVRASFALGGLVALTADIAYVGAFAAAAVRVRGITGRVRAS